MFSSVKRSKLIGVVLLFGCVVGLTVGVSARKLGLFSKSSVPPQLKATNRTASVRISEVRQSDDGGVELTFANQAAKPIYAYTIITTEKPARKGVTVIADGAPLEPGQTKSERIPADNLKSGGRSNPAGVEIVFSALYLEGGLVEGDHRDSEKLERTMAGMKSQATALLEILRTAHDSREQDSGRLLDAIESQVASAPVNETSGAPSKEREDGKRMVNEHLLRAVKKLRTTIVTPGIDVKTQIGEMMPYYKRLAQKL